MAEVFDIKKREKKEKTTSQENEDEIKSMALLEIGRSSYIKRYFQILLMGYNSNIISSSRPSVLESKKMDLIQWHAKKDQIEKMLIAAKDERKTKSK